MARQVKKVLATGRGLLACLDKCEYHGWTKFNTKLVVKDPSDLDSEWIIYAL